MHTDNKCAVRNRSLGLRDDVKTAQKWPFTPCKRTRFREVLPCQDRPIHAISTDPYTKAITLSNKLSEKILFGKTIDYAEKPYK